MEKREAFYIVGGNVNLCTHQRKEYEGSPQNKNELPYDPAIPLLGIYLGKSIIQKDTCSTMFIAALVTIAKTWKQSKYPLTDEQIEKMWYNGI